MARGTVLLSPAAPAPFRRYQPHPTDLPICRARRDDDAAALKRPASHFTLKETVFEGLVYDLEAIELLKRTH